MSKRRNSVVPPFKPIKSVPKLEPLVNVLNLKDTTYIDESFMSESRWTEQEERAYILNLLRGLCITPYIIADAESCLQYCKLINDEQSVKYYSDVLNCLKPKITCDSNNRQNTCNRLKENEIPFPKGTYTLNTASGPYTLNLSEDTLYKNLSDTAKAYVDAIPMLVITITEATRRNLAEVFDAVNRGVNQNAQELRQSWFSNFAQPVRDSARKFHKKFLRSGLTTQKEINRRIVDEFIVDCVHFSISGTELKFNKGSRDDYYVEESKGVSSVSTVESTLSKVWFPPKSDKSPYKITKRTIFVNFMMRTFITKNNYKIVNSKKFDEWLYSTDFKWQDNCPKKLELDTGITYEYKSAGRFHVDFINWNFEIWLEELTKYIEEGQNIISIDSTRFATPHQKLELWRRQGGVCTETKKEIPYTEILDSTKWQADHILEHTNGGLTELDNMRLVAASFNLGRILGPVPITMSSEVAA